jgi:hypothetical protein
MEQKTYNYFVAFSYIDKQGNLKNHCIENLEVDYLVTSKTIYDFNSKVWNFALGLWGYNDVTIINYILLKD